MAKTPNTQPGASREQVVSFEAQLNVFFTENPNVDWLIIGKRSGSVIEYGPSASGFLEAAVNELSVALGEELAIYHRPTTSADTLAESIPTP